MAAYSEATSFSAGMGWYWGCFRSSISRTPRFNWSWVALSEVASELGEGFEFPVLGECQTELSGHLLHGLGLRRTTPRGTPKGQG